MAEKILKNINTPDDLKKVPFDNLDHLADEIRDELIEITSKNGGHLGSNLGVIELTIALHRVFNTPKDKIVFDVGHQGYVHKILTGRREFLHTLRQTNGCSGFLQRDESVYDTFGAGHAGTAVSAALGFAAARDQKGSNEHVIAVVGDGGLGCGITLEGLNNTEDTTKNLIIILNDNKMSISPNVGAMSKYLNKLITNDSYNSIKDTVADFIQKIPKIGESIKNGIHKHLEATKSLFVPGVIFEELGLRYFGPIDGHNLEDLCEVLESAKHQNQPVFIHVLTEKGHHFEPAQNDPEKCHGYKKQDVIAKSHEALKPISSSKDSFSEIFGKQLCKMAALDKRIVGITAGMLSGTAMKHFHELLPHRVYDVGIAEEHATVFAAGLAANGMRPFIGIYATFMQRALDCIYHDICIQELPVVFCVDRAGIVEDGPTHHGIYDIAFLRTLPHLHIMQPRDDIELQQMMELAIKLDYAVAIRYPKMDAETLDCPRAELELGKSEIVRDGKDAVIWASGRETKSALEIADILEEKNISIKVVNTRFIAPLDKESLLADSAKLPVITLEDHVVSGGLGSLVSEILIANKNHGLLTKGLPNNVIPWGNPNDLRRKYDLMPDQIAEDILKFLKK